MYTTVCVHGLYMVVYMAVFTARTWPIWPCTGRVACTRSVLQSCDTACTRSCTRLCTWAVYMYTACTLPCTGRVQAVYMIVFMCSRPVFTARARPCTPVYGPCPCTWPCSLHVHAQRLSVLIQRFNAVILHHSFVDEAAWTGIPAVNIS